MSLLIPGNVPFHHRRCDCGSNGFILSRGGSRCVILRKIRNNFFIAVGLGNCMGFGQLFNKIISGSVPLHHCRCYCGGIDCRITRGDSRCAILRNYICVPFHHRRCYYGSNGFILSRGGSSEQSSLYSVFQHSSASLLLLFPENVGYNPPLSGNPVLTA